MRRSRARHRRTRRPLLTPAFATGALPAGADDAPTLTLAEPEDARGTLVSGTIATALHGLVIAIMVMFAWLAPDVVDDIIPVQILRDLPGSELEPAPAPRALTPRRPAALAAAVVPRAAPQVTQPRVTQVSAESLQMARVDPSLAPTRIEQRQVTSQRVNAQSSIAVPRVAGVDVSDLAAPTVRTEDLSAPVVQMDGPRQVVEGARVDTSAPQVFAAFAERGDVEYSEEAVVSDAPTSDLSGSVFTSEIDDGVAGQFLGGQGTGGTGTAEGVVRCLESTFVLRYLDVIRDRTLSRWRPPPGTPTSERVKLRFTLDASGSATSVEYVEATNTELGRSAAEALRAASPFPPMDDNVRCLTTKKLYGTFDVPAL